MATTTEQVPAVKTYRVLAYHVYEVTAYSADSALEVTTDQYLARDFTSESIEHVQLDVTEKDIPPRADLNTWWK